MKGSVQEKVEDSILGTDIVGARRWSLFEILETKIHDCLPRNLEKIITRILFCCIP